MTNQTTPDYRRWSRDDLITETTRLSMKIEEAEQRGEVTRAQVRRENYHRAQAVLLALSRQPDGIAGSRAIRTSQAHMQQAAKYQGELDRLGGGV